MRRRTFVASGAGGAMAAGGGLSWAASPAETIRVAVLGVNSRGMAHVESIVAQPNVKLVAICDPDQKVLDRRAGEIAAKHKVTVDKVQDLRKLYERKDIDAVTIATPNHWHALAAIWACQAGKHAYVEKPGTHNVTEGRRLMEAAARHKRCVQHGVQLRSSPAVREAVDHLRKGTIGRVYLARGLCYRNRPSVGKLPNEPKPAHLDWDLWQGPATARPFSRRYVHYNWHWHWDYGNGDVGNQGVHQTDLCMWGLGLTQLPNEIVGMGGKFLWADDKETPEVLTCAYNFTAQRQMIEFEVRPWATNSEAGIGVGNIFYGEKGFLAVNGYNSYEITFFDGKKTAPGPKRKDGDPLKAHFANFFAAIRADRPDLLHGGPETAHLSSGLAHLGNISFKLGRWLKFDPVKEQFLGDSEAGALLTREYRAPFAPSVA